MNVRPRIGKTRKDRASGAHQRNRENKAVRGEWSRGRDAKGNYGKFPLYTCNGKKTRAL